MNPPHRVLVTQMFLLLSFGLCLPAASASKCSYTVNGPFPNAPDAFTHTAIGDGGWQIASNWNTGTVPGNDAIVCIPSSRNVAITRQESAEIQFIRVEGILRMVKAQSTQLKVETLYVADGGALYIGGTGNPVHSDKIAELIFLSSGTSTNPFDLSWDPAQASRGLISDGTISLNGTDRTAFVTMTSDVLAGSTTLTVDVDLDTTGSGWQAGDEIVLTGTYFEQGEDTREELLTIASISGDEITIEDTDSMQAGIQGLTYDHSRADTSYKLHVANLTRNVVLTSDDKSETYRRGHVMFKDSDVDVHHVAFVDLGRTDKKIPLDDLDVNQTNGTVSPPSPSQISNPRGRYSVHFHRNGIVPSASSPPSTVHDSVVHGSPGWGFVNHGSHVDFRRNIAYDFDGAGFVAEGGDELGNFVENVAILGNGNGEYPPHQIVFASTTRPQPLSDFGFLGDGFWFQGPAIRAVDNVANGCHGTGMFWFTTGAPDIADIGIDNRNNYFGFPDSAMADTYGGFSDYSTFEGRHWDHATDELVIADLPILECDGLEAYGNFRGFRLRFNNMDSIAWYKELPYAYNGDIVPISGGDESDAVRMRETISNLLLWNNELGVNSRYSGPADFDSIDIVNRLNYSESGRAAGMELFFIIEDTTVADISIDGYVIAGWTANGQGTADVTFSGTQSYTNYAKFDTAIPPFGECLEIDEITATVIGSDEIQLSWSQESEHSRYLVRYWIDGKDYVQFHNETKDASSPQVVNLTGLDADTTYKFQVMPGCTYDDMMGTVIIEPAKYWGPIPADSATTDP